MFASLHSKAHAKVNEEKNPNIGTMTADSPPYLAYPQVITV